MMADQPHVTADVDLVRLQTIFDESISEHDHAPATRFVDAAEAVDWASKDAKAIEAAVHMALSLDAVQFARQLAKRGHELHPDSDALYRATAVLGPPKKAKPYLPRTSVGASIEWVQNHPREYSGLWVAVKNGQLIGTAATRDALIAQISPYTKEDRVLVTRMG